MSRDLQQQSELDPKAAAGADVDVDAEHDPEVSRRASNAGLRRAVQKKGPDGMAPEQVHAAAERGTSAPGQRLPHHDQIQAAFGEHDISGIQAHVDPSSTRAMGAQAYASGNHVVFDQQPDLHTAAHEAAHVVQQAQGVHLKGGVGAEGDAHEQAADAVADRVVAGKPAGDLLGPVAAAPAGGAQAVQRKPAAKAADPKAAHNASDRESYDSVQAALLHLAKEFHAWIPELRSATHADTSGPAGQGPAQNAISAIFDAAMNDAERVGQLISAANDRQTLSPEVKIVQGAFTRFYPYIDAASNWMYSHGCGSLGVRDLINVMNGYTSKIGYEQELEPTTTEPEGDEKSLSKAMVNGQFAAIQAALASVKAGNDADVARITLHLRYLGGVRNEHGAEIKSHRAQLKRFLKELTEIRHDKPEFAERLVEAHNDLVALLGQ